VLFSCFYTLLSTLVTVNTTYAFYFFLLHHCTNSLSSQHFFVQHCTFCASLHVRASPAGAVIWIEISVPCAHILRLWNYQSVDTRVSSKPGTHLERGRQGLANGYSYFGRTENTRKKSNYSGVVDKEHRKIENMKKGEEKWVGHQRYVCLGMK